MAKSKWTTFGVNIVVVLACTLSVYALYAVAPLFGERNQIQIQKINYIDREVELCVERYRFACLQREQIHETYCEVTTTQNETLITAQPLCTKLHESQKYQVEITGLRLPGKLRQITKFQE